MPLFCPHRGEHRDHGAKEDADIQARGAVFGIVQLHFLSSAVGVAGGIGEAVLFSHGKILRRIPENVLVDELVKEVRILAEKE